MGEGQESETRKEDGGGDGEMEQGINKGKEGERRRSGLKKEIETTGREKTEAVGGRDAESRREQVGIQWDGRSKGEKRGRSGRDRHA